MPQAGLQWQAEEAQRQLNELAAQRAALIRDGRYDEARILNEHIMEMLGTDVSAPGRRDVEAAAGDYLPQPELRLPGREAPTPGWLGEMMGGVTPPEPPLRAPSGRPGWLADMAGGGGEMTGGAPLEWGEWVMPPVDNEVPLVEEQDDASLVEDGPPPRVDAYGIPLPPASSSTGPTPVRIAEDLIRQDTTRGGTAFTGWNKDAEHDVGKITPVDEDGKFLGGLRKKVGGFFGHDSEEELGRFGSALMGFGSGVLTGGQDIGEAIGHGFAKAQNQFVATKLAQRDAGLDDYRMQMDEEQREMARERMNEWRRQTALDRVNDPIKQLLEREKAHQAGVRVDEDGNYYIDRSASGPAIPDEAVELQQMYQYLMTPEGERLLLPGESPGEGARRILKIKVDDNLLEGIV